MKYFWMIFKLSIISIVFLGLFSLSSCQSSTEKTTSLEEKVEIKEQKAEIQEELEKAKQVYYRLPSPLESAMLLKRAKATYDEEVLNPVSNVSKYNTNLKMALNLGIYSADLSFASLFDKTQASIHYMAAAKKMAEGLGILNSIKESTIKRLENNVNDRDSIMFIISETFMSSESFLDESGRASEAALIFYGGWIEGLYIATQLAQKSNTINEILLRRITDERLSLDLVFKLLGKFYESEDVQTVLPDVKDLKIIFEKINVTKNETKSNTDPESKTTVINSGTKAEISEEVFNELSSKIEEIRTNYIK